jgi:hypothetical protein
VLVACVYAPGAKTALLVGAKCGKTREILCPYSTCRGDWRDVSHSNPTEGNSNLTEGKARTTQHNCQLRKHMFIGKIQRTNQTSEVGHVPLDVGNESKSESRCVGSVVMSPDSTTC